jgi:alanyl-tRNA synthetase
MLGLSMTERLYYTDCYLREFDARVVDLSEDGRRVYLDRTAFYPASGGQPFDTGTLGGVAVTEVADEGERIAHVLAAPLPPGPVRGVIDWERRYGLMQQHSGQHLLSAVFEELFGFKTVSVHIGLETNTVDLETGAINEGQLAAVEERCAAVIAQARPVEIAFEDAGTVSGLRKESAREGKLRVVSIAGVDRSACGGAHVRNSAEIGLVLTGKTDKIRGLVRVEFVCGVRALRRARSDHRLLAAIGRAVALPPDQAPERIAALIEQNKALEKERQRLAAELARREGRELYQATAADRTGLHRVEQRTSIDDAVRIRAQAFASGERALFLAVSEQPPALLLAVSADSGWHAGERMKAAMAAAGGRGGGNAQLAQGSVPDAAALARALALLQ